MKTVLDAVIEFKGECGAAVDSNVAYSSDSLDWLVGLHFSLTDTVFICTTDEFNALVDELASNFGECDISYQKHCSNEVIRLEGDEMKTVLDAVIEFKGELPVDVSSPWYFGQNESGLSIYIGFDNRKACAIDEFTALVAELASNFGKCDISYKEHCENETIRLEGDEMKTITHEGKVIQIGAVYELSDDGKDWELKVLTEVSDSAWPFFPVMKGLGISENAKLLLSAL